MAAEAPSASYQQLSALESRTPAIPPIPNVTEEEQQELEGGRGPVIITVAGLNFDEIGWGYFELRYLRAIINYFVAQRASISEQELVEEIEKFRKSYYYSEYWSAITASICGHQEPDNYMEARLRQELHGLDRGDTSIVQFYWTRDPEDTYEAIPVFEQKLAEVCRMAAENNRPVHVLAHSWGSILMHEALLRLEKSHPEYRIDEFITVGSPLNPSDMVVKIFKRFQEMKEYLNRTVEKPGNVRNWINYWAARDLASNSIPAADENILVARDVEDLVPQLRKIADGNSAISEEAKKDLGRFLNIRNWHYSYIEDFRAEIKTLGKSVYVPVFKPYLEPALLD